MNYKNHLQNYSEKTLALYKKNLNKMNLEHRIHFIQRYFKMYGELLSKKDVNEFINSKIKFLERYINSEKHFEGYKYKQPDLRKHQKEEPKENFRFEKRKKFYKKNPSIHLLTEIIRFFYKVVHFTDNSNLYDMYKNKIVKLINSYDLFQFELYFVDPVRYVNIIYWLHNLNIIDKRELTTKYLPKLEQHEDFNILDYYYTLTHIVIGESNFYQKFVNSKQRVIKEIIRIFERNIKEIYEETNLDIFSEVGICLRLCNIKNIDSYSFINKKLIERYDSDSNLFIQYENNELQDMEHANILIILYNHLSQSNKLYQMPLILNKNFYEENC